MVARDSDPTRRRWKVPETERGKSLLERNGSGDGGAENPSSKEKVRTRPEEQASKLTGEGHAEKRAAQYGGGREGAPGGEIDHFHFIFIKHSVLDYFLGDLTKYRGKVDSVLNGPLLLKPV